MGKLEDSLKEIAGHTPKFGKVEFIFRDGVVFDIIKEERVRVK